MPASLRLAQWTVIASEVSQEKDTAKLLKLVEEPNRAFGKTSDWHTEEGTVKASIQGADQTLLDQSSFSAKSRPHDECVDLDRRPAGTPCAAD